MKYVFGAIGFGAVFLGGWYLLDIRPTIAEAVLVITAAAVSRAIEAAL